MSQQPGTSDENADQHSTKFSSESANTSLQHHYHDAFGAGDAGINYGSHMDFEDGGYDSINGDGANTVESTVATEARQMSLPVGLGSRSTTEPVGNTATTSLDELHEEVGLHETTLSTLHSKLTSLSSQIEAEEALAVTLREEIQLLGRKKVILKKKTEGNLEMVKRVEGTLEKTLGRLRAALGREDEIKEVQETIQHNVYEDDFKIAPSILDVRDDSPAQQYLVPNLENDVIDVERIEDTETAIDGHEYRTESAASSYIEIPLHLDSIQTIQWPATDDLKYAINSVIPKWRTNLPSPSLWNIDSADLLAQLINITASENLIERQLLVDQGLLLSDAGWVKESCIQGTSLDVYTHVDCKGWLHTSRTSAIEHTDYGPLKETIDPNAILCPYELRGTCADDRCPYQHLDRRPPESLITLRDGRRFLRYDDLPVPKLPPPLSIDDFIGEKELLHDKKSDISGKKTAPSEQRPSTKVYLCPTCANISLSSDNLLDHMKQCNISTLVVDGTEYSVHNVLVDENIALSADITEKHVTNNSPGSLDEHAGAMLDFTENHDLVHLPTVTVNSDSESSDESVADSKNPSRKGSMFNNRYWWQHLIARPNKEYSALCHEVIDLILLSFGFQPIRDYESGHGISQISQLRCSKVCLESYTSPKPQDGKSRELEEIFLIARVVDVCQICVHMGHLHIGLSLLRGVPRSRVKEYHLNLLQHVVDCLKSILYSRSACDVFTCQVRLRIISEFYRIRYNWLAQSNSKSSDQPNSDKLLAFLLDTSITIDHDVMIHLKSRMPPEDASQCGWEEFVACLQLQLEKYIVVPLSYKMTGEEELSFLLDCGKYGIPMVLDVANMLQITKTILIVQQSGVIGKILQELAISIHDESFSPLTQILEPVWSIIQRVFNGSSARHLEGKCDIASTRLTIAIILIGPVIFACTSKIILPRSYQVLKYPENQLPAFDSRRRLDLLALDKFIVEIIKDIRRYGRNQEKCGNVESLLAPVIALSTAICVSLGLFDKAQMRLENTLNSKCKFKGEEAPSIQVISGMLWSQLVQIRMNCPSFHHSICLDTEKGLSNLHSTIIEANGELSSSAIASGTIICGFSSCGDRCMISAAVSNSADRLQWQNLVTFAAENHPSNLNRTQKERTLNNNFLEFSISNPELEKMPCVEFPRSLLVAGQSLTKLSLIGCMLDMLPYSFGSQLACLQVSENIQFANLCTEEKP